MSLSKPDFAPWLLLPGIALTLSGITLLAPRQAAQAAAPKAAVSAPKADAYDDGDGDELLEHWGDPQFSQEEQRQMAGMAAGFLVLGAAALRRRALKGRKSGAALPSEADFLKLTGAAAVSADSRPHDTRKAA